MQELFTDIPPGREPGSTFGGSAVQADIRERFFRNKNIQL